MKERENIFNSQGSPDFNEHGLVIKPLSSLMVAEIIGFDLRNSLSVGERAMIYEAFLRYQLLLFRDQSLSKQQQIEFTQQFGTLESHTQGNRGMDEFPSVHVVSNLNEKGPPSGKLDSTLLAYR